MQEIVIGVVSGVLSAVVILVAGTIARQILIPWFRSITYSGVDISGEWHCIDPTMAQEITLNLVQKASFITGTATFTWDHEETSKNPREFEVVRTFNISGSIQDRFVQLTLRHVNPKRIGIHNYLLEVCGDGRKMEGVFSFYSVRRNNIGSSVHLLFRDRSLAEQISGKLKAERRLRRLELLEEIRELEIEDEAEESQGEIKLNEAEYQEEINFNEEDASSHLDETEKKEDDT